MKSSFLLLGIFYCFQVYSQSPLYPVQSLSTQLLQRSEIKSGTLRNEIFFDMQPFTRDEGRDYITENQSSLVVNGDSSIYRYLVNENVGWSKNNIQSSKSPMFKWFYQDPANLYIIREDDFEAYINPVILYSQTYEQDYPSDDLIFKNERGIELRGNISKKLGFYTYFTDNQARYPSYVSSQTSKGALPGEGFFKRFKETGFDHYTARGHITFDALKHIKFTLGHGRNFIGNGTRSLILSDFAKDYLHVKVNTKIWRFNYQNLFAEFVDRQALVPNRGLGLFVHPKKYFASHYLSLDLLKNLNIGLYEGVVFSDRDGTGRAFDLNYLNPIIFYRAVEHSVGNSPDNVMMGLNLHYLPAKGISLYSQLMIDEFKFSEITSNDKWWGNKYGIQLGAKMVDLFNIKNLDLTTEYNSVRPHTYQHDTSGSSFLHYNQPLAHPLGANFNEVLVKLRFIPIKKLFVNLGYTHSVQGLDSAGFNFGGDIYLETPPYFREYGVLTTQGNKAVMNRFDINLSYMLRHNLFLEGSVILRGYQTEDLSIDRNDLIFNVGIRWNAIPKNLLF